MCKTEIDTGNNEYRIGRISALNDVLRITLLGGKVQQTKGVNALPIGSQDDAVVQLRAYDSFTPDNDPSGMHDFGEFTVGDHCLFFKIDCYSPDGKGSS